MKNKFMKKIKKALCVTVSIMLLGSLAGCGSNDAPVGSRTEQGSESEAVTSKESEVSKESEATKEEPKEIVKLKMILTGEKPAIYDEIYGKLNEMLREDIGAELEIEYYSSADLHQKLSLLFSSGEEVDIVFAANWALYSQYASKNAFMEITDEMLQQYAPETYETLTTTAKNEAKVSGKMYMVPNTAAEYKNYVTLIRGDLREKYGMDEITTLEEFEIYLEKVAENEESIVPLVDIRNAAYYWHFYADRKNYIEIAGTGIAYDLTEGTFGKTLYSDWYLKGIEKTREFVDKGIIPPDLVANTTTQSMFENGKTATYVSNLETCASKARQVREEHPEWKIEICDFSVGVPKVLNPSISNGLALSRTTKNAEKSLQLIELLRNDKRYFDLTWYGIEGKHWEADGENGIVSLNASLPQEEQYVPGNVWGWKNQTMLRSDATEIPEKKEILARWQEETIESDINGFVFDNTSVKNEITSISNASSQYGKPLMYGMVEADEIDASIATYQEVLKQAGIDKVYDEVLKQYEEYQNSLK